MYSLSHCSPEQARRESIQRFLSSSEITDADRYTKPYFPLGTSAGLLSRDDIHHAVDRLELSFYLEVTYVS